MTMAALNPLFQTMINGSAGVTDLDHPLKGEEDCLVLDIAIYSILFVFGIFRSLRKS